MTSISAVYAVMQREFFKEQIGSEDAILFFQGFSNEFYTTLSTGPISHFCNRPTQSLIEVRNADASFLVQNFLESQGCVWGFYEELIILADQLSNFGIGKKTVYVVRNNLYTDFYPLNMPCNAETLHRIYEDDLASVDDEGLLKFYSGYQELDGVNYFAYVNRHYPVDITSEVKELEFFVPTLGKANDGGLPQNIIIPHDLPGMKLDLERGQLPKGDYVIRSLSSGLEREIVALNCLASHFDSHFSLDQTRLRVEGKSANAYRALLKRFWGEQAEFYHGTFYQEPAYDNTTYELSQGVLVANIIEQCEKAFESHTTKYSDLIVTAPTGSGKSLFFQLPGIHLHENYNALTIVVCPLLALMKDQVQELHERGVDFATYINSEISYEERQARLEGIINGEYSIVYLSPELLLSYDLTSLIGDRRIGLFVIDEAHLVTSWGRDFRVDYWFLGDYLERTRSGSYYSKNKSGRPFPVLCLTATAVYGGRDDVIEDLQRSLNLNCSTENLYVGYVKRDNIGFEINTLPRQPRGSEKEQKIGQTCRRAAQFIDEGEKSIVYFPFVSQIDDVERELTANFPQTKDFMNRYSGSGMSALEKNEAYNRFRESDNSVMLATKAFGMGINIPDVSNVYHFAPTGTLADYVQEIGRAARKLERGYAVIDYSPNDMRYAKALWGLSGLRHYQIKAIMKKLYDMYQTKKSRHLLFSADTFSYLFEPNSLDMKVKSGLMLLSADLLETYHFRVINVRPKNLFSSHYIVVPRDVEAEFMQQFGAYCTRMLDDRPRVTPGYGSRATVVTTNLGDIFEIDLARVWENEFEDFTFARFKYLFFNGDLFSFGTDKVVARMKLIINYEQSYDHAVSNLLAVAEALQKTFNQLRRSFGGKQFEFSDFATSFGKHYGKKVRREYLLLLLDIFCYERTEIYEIPGEQWKFIERRKKVDGQLPGYTVYSMRTSKYNYVGTNLKRYLRMAAPNDSTGKCFVTYLPIPKRGQTYSSYQLISSLLELFGFATYDLVGGRNPQIFVRINDPMKLARISSSKTEYRNRFLTDIEQRHKRAAVIIDRFMSAKLSDEDRWSVIENYFLGFDDLVDYQLGIGEAAVGKDS